MILAMCVRGPDTQSILSLARFEVAGFCLSSLRDGRNYPVVERSDTTGFLERGVRPRKGSQIRVRHPPGPWLVSPIKPWSRRRGANICDPRRGRSGQKSSPPLLDEG